MSMIESCVKIEGKVRRAMSFLPPQFACSVYSPGRKLFISVLKDSFPEKYIAPEEYSRTLWGLKFSSPVMNAAGMFKKGEGYRLCLNQGAGAYLAGTSTGTPRKGNYKNRIMHPFMPLPYSGAAINWMGLPNPGTEKLARIISEISKKPGCPVGASVSSSPDLQGIEALEELLAGLNMYDMAGADFIELNESCPNVPHEKSKKKNILDNASCEFESKPVLDALLLERLQYISKKFLSKRRRNLPVIVKFSNDTDKEMIPGLIDILVELGFDGINLGNTSIKYGDYMPKIAWNDRKAFDYFTDTFGGGLSGLPLKENSLKLAAIAAAYIREKELSREFRVIRTGGFFDKKDLAESEKAGIDLNQWFTGYFEGFAKHGHKLYKALYE